MVYVFSQSVLHIVCLMLKAEVLESMLYGCVTWSPRSYHYDALRRAQNIFLTRCIGWRKHRRTDHPIPYVETLLKTVSESIEATLRNRRILFAGPSLTKNSPKKCGSLVSLAFLFLFLFALFFPLDWIFPASLSGELFPHSFLQFVPRGGSFLFVALSPPVQQTTDRIGNRILFFLGGYHKVGARSVNVMNPHTHISHIRM